MEVVTVRLTDEQRLLVQDNRGLVYPVANRYKARIRSGELDDMLQDGFCGLCRAAQLFDPERGFKFSTYATGWIWSKIAAGRRLRRGTKRNIESPQFQQSPFDLMAHHDGGGARVDSADHAEALLRMLGRAERTVIVRRFGLGGNRAETFRQIGHKMGITGPRVKQIQDAAIAKLAYTAANGR